MRLGIIGLVDIIFPPIKLKICNKKRQALELLQKSALVNHIKTRTELLLFVNLLLLILILHFPIVFVNNKVPFICDALLLLTLSIKDPAIL